MNNKIFDYWNILKKKISKTERNFFIHKKEIWWMKMGKNIGDEQDGKGDLFLRPILILKLFTKDLFFGIPLTTTLRDGNYFFNFKFFNLEDEKISDSCAILIQGKAFSKKRLFKKIGNIKNKDFSEIKKQLNKILTE